MEEEFHTGMRMEIQLHHDIHKDNVEVCANCSSPFGHSSVSHEEKNSVNYMLSKIYNLHFILILKQSQPSSSSILMTNDDCDLSLDFPLCPVCSQQLTILYTQFSQFNQLRKLESLLAKQIDTLNNLITQSIPNPGKISIRTNIFSQPAAATTTTIAINRCVNKNKQVFSPRDGPWVKVGRRLEDMTFEEIGYAPRNDPSMNLISNVHSSQGQPESDDYGDVETCPSPQDVYDDDQEDGEDASEKKVFPQPLLLEPDSPAATITSSKNRKKSAPRPTRAKKKSPPKKRKARKNNKKTSFIPRIEEEENNAVVSPPSSDDEPPPTKSKSRTRPPKDEEENISVVSPHSDDDDDDDDYEPPSKKSKSRTKPSKQKKSSSKTKTSLEKPTEKKAAKIEEEKVAEASKNNNSNVDNKSASAVGDDNEFPDIVLPAKPKVMTYEEILAKKPIAQYKQKPGYLYAQRQLNAPCPCLYCLEDFQTAEERANHTREVHCTKKRKLLCTICGRILGDPRDYKFHVDSRKCTATRDPALGLPTKHKKGGQKVEKKVEKEFACNKPLNNSTGELCSYRAKNNFVLSRHIAAVHESDERDKVECNECHKILKNEGIFKSHYYRMHTEEGRKAHAKYEQRFRDKEKAKRREKNAKGFVCSTCNVDYLTKHRYTIHMKQVHDEFPKKEAIVQCEQCGKKFPGAHRLRRHLLTHTDAREFICELCGKDFKTQNNLKGHLKLTHDEEGRRRYNAYTRDKNRKVKLIQAAIARKEQGGNAVGAPDPPLNINNEAGGDVGGAPPLQGNESQVIGSLGNVPAESSLNLFSYNMAQGF